jgi:hypothetical protein
MAISPLSASGLAAGFNPYRQESDKSPAARTKENRASDAGNDLSEKEQKQVEQLKKIDAEVRAHEAAHQAAAGGLARGKSFKYVAGPDGQRYAVGGEVQIDTSAVPGDPQATIQKAQQIRRAALAPAQPSGQDMSVASGAAALEAKARRESISQNDTSSQKNEESGTNTAAARMKKAYGSQSSPAAGALYSRMETCASGCTAGLACNHLPAGLASSLGISARG